MSRSVCLASTTSGLRSTDAVGRRVFVILLIGAEMGLIGNIAMECFGDPRSLDRDHCKHLSISALSVCRFSPLSHSALPLAVLL